MNSRIHLVFIVLLLLVTVDETTAQAAGRRHGPVAVLRVRAGEMARSGMTFYLSANGVWLTDTVPPHFIEDVNAGEPSQPK